MAVLQGDFVFCFKSICIGLMGLPVTPILKPIWALILQMMNFMGNTCIEESYSETRKKYPQILAAALQFCVEAFT